MTYARSASRRPYAASPRITRSNLLTLRSAEMRDDNKVRKIFAAICSEFQALIGGLFAMQPQKKNSMCKYYGHVIRGTWSGYLPKCDDCGCEVNNPSMLRKASAQQVKA